MLSRRLAIVESIEPHVPLRGDWSRAIQYISTQFGPAINFIEFAGTVAEGDTVLLNRTANDLQLGTGGDDFVIARISPLPDETESASREDAHIMRLRYTPLQISRPVIEDDDRLAGIWDKRLDVMPVVAGELHSQLAPVAAAFYTTCQPYLQDSPRRPRFDFIHPVITDAAALPSSNSRLIGSLFYANLINPPIHTGQAFGPGNNAVTLHNALIFVRHRRKTRCSAFVCQGPGNTGTNTKYGFSGIEQASNLDIAAALGGAPIACVRASSGDARERHRGISHHSRTVLELVRSRCTVPLPEGLDPDPAWLDRHDVRAVPREKTQPALDLLTERGINVTTMGRSVAEDPLFFHAAAAAGVVAAEIAASLLFEARGN